MKSVINEELVARKLLKDGGLYINSYHTVLILSKYFYLTACMSKKDIINSIDDFMSENYSYYNIIETPEYIETRVNAYWRHKTEYVKIESVGITLSELEHIRELSNIIQEKIMFTILVDAKINMLASDGKSDGWTKRELDDLVKDAKLHGTYERKFLQTNEAFRLGGINYTKDVNGSGMQVEFLDHEAEPAIVLSDMRNYVYEYLRWRGESICNCEECGIRIKMTNNKKIYCDECAISVKKEQDKRYYEKFRK